MTLRASFPGSIHDRTERGGRLRRRSAAASGREPITAALVRRQGSGDSYILHIGLWEKPAQPCGQRTEEELREPGLVAADHDSGRALRSGGGGERLIQGRPLY